MKVKFLPLLMMVVFLSTGLFSRLSHADESSDRESFNKLMILMQENTRGLEALLLRTRVNSTADGIPVCDPIIVARSSPGYVCHADGVLWSIENETYGRDKVQVYKDWKHNIKVTAILNTSGERIMDRYVEQECSDGYHLPSGYPKELNGQETGDPRCSPTEAVRDGVCSFPNHDSDFVTLEADHIRQVVPGMVFVWGGGGDFYIPQEVKRYWEYYTYVNFWTSSSALTHPVTGEPGNIADMESRFDTSYVFRSETGRLEPQYKRYGRNLSYVLCVHD